MDKILSNQKAFLITAPFCQSEAHMHVYTLHAMDIPFYGPI